MLWGPSGGGIAQRSLKSVLVLLPLSVTSEDDFYEFWEGVMTQSILMKDAKKRKILVQDQNDGGA